MDEIANATGRPVRTVKQKLSKMYNLGMSEPLGDGLWRAIQNVDLDKIAQELGTTGMGDEQKRKHAVDRRCHRTVLDVGRRLRAAKVETL